MALAGYSQAMPLATAPARSTATTASVLLSPSPAQRPGPDHRRPTRQTRADLRRLSTPRTTATTSLAHKLAAPSAAAAASPVGTAAAAAAATVPGPSAPPLECEVQQATTAAELRAAAFLRAVSFYTYPPGRSEYAARSHRHMKANAEWESVTAKVEGRDVAYRDLDVTCFIATVDDSADGSATEATGGASSSGASAASGAAASPPAASQPDSAGVTATSDRGELLTALRGCLDACAQLPAEPGSGPGPRPGGDPRVGGAAVPPRPRRLVVGSLDLNVGHTLPSEELIGRNPQADPRRRRAYLSNVCVAPAARRLGVARALLRYVEDVARRAGVEWLYVHVVADNAPAVALYCDALGFQVEQSESEGYARSLQRPRRLLLAKCLLPPGEPRQQQQPPAS